MCHDFLHPWREEVASLEAAEPDEESTPSFLNEERDADVELLTDGGE